MKLNSLFAFPVKLIAVLLLILAWQIEGGYGETLDEYLKRSV